MKILNMSSKKFNELELLQLPNNVFNTEAIMYVLEEKEKWVKNKFLLKRFYRDSGTVFSNKLYTINELIDRKDDIGIDELVMPEKLISVHGDIVGFSMPFIKNINFQTVLNSDEFTPLQKIAYFKQIGEILEKMRKVRKYTDLSDFYINDLHENNFILNLETDRINAVDLDSCKISHNLTFGSRYLSFFTPMSNVSKYSKIDEPFSIGAYFKVDQNTDYYCYNLMILNYLYDGVVNRLNIGEFYCYLEYLHSLGVSYELIDMFSLIYMEKDNVNPYEYLDELVNVVDKSSYKVYRLNRK